VSSESERPSVRFEPLRPASRGRLIVGLVLGPVLWLVALIVAALIFDYSSAIALGLLVTVASFFISLVVLALVRAARRRQERRFADAR
jgi:membrane protein implicated in regulation of membrane protease activity